MSNPYLGDIRLTKLKGLHELLRIFNMVIYLVNIQEERDEIESRHINQRFVGLSVQVLYLKDIVTVYSSQFNESSTH